MLKFAKKIWLLFYFIVFIATALLALAVYQKYDEILAHSKSDLWHANHSYHNRLNALLKEQEILQNVFANTYLNNPEFNNHTFTTLKELNPLFVGLAIFSQQGELQFSSVSNLQGANLQGANLLDSENTQQWFQEALNTEQMVIGKAYLLENISKWILPVRKRVLDGEGNVVAVIATALDLTMLAKTLDEEEYLHNSMQVTLDNGAFPILRSPLKVEQYSQYYNNALPDNRLLGQDFSSLKTRLAAENSSYLAPVIQNGEDSQSPRLIYTLSYNPRYHFWVSAEMPYQLVVQKLYQQVHYYFVFYALLIGIIFTLFRWIIKNEIKKINELTYNAEHDALTGLTNHTVIKKHFIRMQRDKRTPFALLYLKLDNFNNINKAFGHNYGQLILAQVAKRIEQSLAPCDEHFANGKRLYCPKTGKLCLVGLNALACRYSGDEFVIFIESENRDEIADCAKLILKNIAQPYLTHKSAFKVSGSIGIARFPDDALEIETLLSYADSSIERAQTRRNQYQFFSPSNYSQLTRNIEIEQSLSQAIKHKEITLVYQPQLDKEHRLIGVEALVRWQSEKLGFVPPDLFIPIAEKAGYMRQLGLYIMHRAMQDIASLKKQEGLALQLSINVSAKQFMQGDFMKKLLEACTLHAMDPATVTVEITESLFIERFDRLASVFKQMKAHNMTLSLDDFGTGYSSLNMLKKVPIDELKIDKSFVDHIVTNHTDNAMMETIINMGKALRMKIVAEGVEDELQGRLLDQAGCDIFQGYYFSKPLALEELRNFAKEYDNSLQYQSLRGFNHSENTKKPAIMLA